MAVPDILAKGMIAFDGDDSELIRKYFELENKTKALGKSIESGLYTAVQRGAMRAAKEFKSLENAVKKQVTEEVYAEEIAAGKRERRRKREVTEALRAERALAERRHGYRQQAPFGLGGSQWYLRYREGMHQQGMGHVSLTSQLFKGGGVGAGVVYGAAAMAGRGPLDTMNQSMKMLSLTAGRMAVPALTNTTAWLQRLAKRMDEFQEKHPGASRAIGNAAIYGGGALVGLGLLGAGVRGLGLLRTGASTVMTMARAGLGLSFGAGAAAGATGATLGGLAAPMARLVPTAGYAGSAAQVGSTVARLAPAAGSGAVAAAGARGLLGTVGRVASRAFWPTALAYGAYELADWATGGAVSDTIYDAFHGGVGTGDSKRMRQQQAMAANVQERQQKMLMGRGPMDLSSYDVTGYRDAAQQAGLSTSPLEAQNLKLELKNYLEQLKEVAEINRQAANNLNNAANNLNGKGPSAPGGF